MIKLRSENWGKAKDLQEIICVEQATVDATSKDHFDWAKRLKNLGVRLRV